MIAGMVALRSAELADCERVWQWNFAPDVRAQSKDPRVVPYDEHARWFEDRIARGSPIWIVEADGAAVGVVRIDERSEATGGGADRGRISISLAASARGRGIGRRAIALASTAWAAPIVAEVAASNIASRACFEACGFVAASHRDGLVTYYWAPLMRPNCSSHATTTTACRVGPDPGRVGE